MLELNSLKGEVIPSTYYNLGNKSCIYFIQFNPHDNLDGRNHHLISIHEKSKMKKMWYIYIYTMDYYSAINKNEIMSFAGKWMKLEIMLSEINQAQKYHIFTHMKNMDLKNNMASLKRGLFGGSQQVG
jgi:hypothetical protein